MIIIKQLIQYSFIELLKIGVFKIGYRVVLLFEKNKFSYSKNVVVELCQTTKYNFDNLHRLINKFPLLPLRAKQTTIDEIEAGRILIFSQKFNIDSWLKDPISGNKWPHDEFFANARTKINGYGDVKYVLELNKFNHLVTVATAFYFDKEERHILYIEKQLKSWIQEIKYGYSVVNRIVMDCAFRCINLIFISIYCSKSIYFKTKVYPLIHQILLFQEREITKFNTPRWFKTGNGANHVIGEMVGLIVLKAWLSLMTNQKFSTKKEYKWLYQTLDKLISPEGVYLEHSSNYSRLVAEFLVVLDMFESCFLLHHNTREKYLKSILTYIISMSQHSHLPNFGDNDAASVLIPYKDSFDDITPLYKYAKYLNCAINTSKILSSFVKSGQFIWKSFDELDLYVFVRCGEWSIFRQGASVHTHNDLLSLILMYGNKEIFVDNGCYFYNQSLDIKNEYIRTSSHNTVYIHGFEQADYVGPGWYNYPETAVSNEYSPNSIFDGSIRYKDVKHHRIIQYLKPKMIVHDKIFKPSVAVAHYHYLLHESIDVKTENDNALNLFYKNKILAKVVIEGANVEIREEAYYPHYANKIYTKAITGLLNSDKVTTIIEFYK